MLLGIGVAVTKAGEWINKNGGVVGSSALILIWVEGLKNGGAVDLTDGGVEEHCFANPFPADGFLSAERILGGGVEGHIEFFYTLQMCACRFPRGGKGGTAGHQRGQCGCSGAAVLSDNAAAPASAVLNRQMWSRREAVPVKPTALEQNRTMRTRQSPAAPNTTYYGEQQN
jgi:hypothetical protein